MEQDIFTFVSECLTARPQLDKLEYICDYFSITLSEFFAPDLKHSMRLNELNREAEHLTGEQLAAATELIKQMCR